MGVTRKKEIYSICVEYGNTDTFYQALHCWNNYRRYHMRGWPVLLPPRRTLCTKVPPRECLLWLSRRWLYFQTRAKLFEVSICVYLITPNIQYFPRFDYEGRVIRLDTFSKVCSLNFLHRSKAFLTVASRLSPQAADWDGSLATLCLLRGWKGKESLQHKVLCANVMQHMARTDWINF